MSNEWFVRRTWGLVWTVVVLEVLTLVGVGFAVGALMRHVPGAMQWLWVPVVYLMLARARTMTAVVQRISGEIGLMMAAKPPYNHTSSLYLTQLWRYNVVLLLLELAPGVGLPVGLWHPPARPAQPVPPAASWPLDEAAQKLADTRILHGNSPFGGPRPPTNPFTRRPASTDGPTGSDGQPKSPFGSGSVFGARPPRPGTVPTPAPQDDDDERDDDDFDPYTWLETLADEQLSGRTRTYHLKPFDHDDDDDDDLLADDADDADDGDDGDDEDDDRPVDMFPGWPRKPPDDTIPF